MTTADAITRELEADEAATLADPIIRQMARAAVALAEKTAHGASNPNPALPGDLYGKVIADHARLARLRFIAERGDRPTGATGGWFTRDEVLRDVTVIMRQAAKQTPQQKPARQEADK